MTQQQSWLDLQHPEYARRVDRWVFTRDHYTGDALLPGNVEHYLVQKTAGESSPAFRERCAIADMTAHLATVVDSLVGMLFAVEEDAERRWTDPKQPTRGALGDPDVSTSPAARLADDADGDGTDWVTCWKRAAIELTLQHVLWVLVDTTPDGDPVVRLIDAERVPNWRHEGGRLVDVVLTETHDARVSILGDPDIVERWVHFTPFGWSRYEKDKQGRPMLTGSATYVYEDTQRRPTLPIFPVTLPMPRMVGWLMARKANAIFNRESERDALLRLANFPKLNVVADDTLFAKIEQKLAAGANLLQVTPGTEAHGYIAPSAECATVATDVLRRKVEEFYVTAFREYGDAARERTATEVRQDVAAGVGAFLQLLKSAVDEAERRALFLLEQAQAPDDRSRWGHAYVSRSDDFLPIDINAVIERIRTRIFGDAPVPVGKTARADAARMIAEREGLTVDEDELSAALDLEQLRRDLALLAELDLTPEVKAFLAGRFVRALATPAELAGLGDLDASLQDAARSAAEDRERARRALARIGSPPSAPEDDVAEE